VSKRGGKPAMGGKEGKESRLRWGAMGERLHSFNTGTDYAGGRQGGEQGSSGKKRLRKKVWITGEGFS